MLISIQVLSSQSTGLHLSGGYCRNMFNATENFFLVFAFIMKGLTNIPGPSFPNEKAYNSAYSFSIAWRFHDKSIK
jgi:hypothetical protein